MSSDRVLVTGATGNVGRPVLDALVAAGVPVRAAAGTPSGLARLEKRTRGVAGLETVLLDFTGPETWTQAYSGVDRLFLLRPPHLGRPRTQMLPSLEAAKAAGVQHVVFLSLQGAEHNRVVPHATVESWLRTSGLGWTFVRASFFMQNLTTTHCSDISDRGELVVPAGSGATAFVDAEDVAAVAAAALLEPGSHRDRAWTPTGPEALTYAEVAARLSEVLGRPIRYDAPGVPRYARHARRELGMPWGMVAVTSAIYSAARLGKADGLTDDVAAATGREPTSFDAFARREAHRWEPGPGARPEA